MKKKTKDKIISTLNEGSKDSDPIIESPSGVFNDSAYSEAMGKLDGELRAKDAVELASIQFSSKVAQLIRDISFLRERMIKDYNQIGLFLGELRGLIPNLKSADYYLNEGLDSLKTGVEILKDCEVKK